MNKRILILLSLGSASALATFLAACGDDSSVSDGGTDATTDGTQGTDTGNDVAVNDSGNDTGASDAGSDVATGPCNGSDAGCKVCCNALHPEAGPFRQAAETTCACTSPGVCNTPQTCKNELCSGNTIQAQCTACLQDLDSGADAGSCAKTADNACLANTDCKAWAACTLACP